MTALKEEEQMNTAQNRAPHKRMRNGISSRHDSSASSKVTCPICNEAYSKSVIEQHAANCGDEVYVWRRKTKNTRKKKLKKKMHFLYQLLIVRLYSAFYVL